MAEFRERPPLADRCKNFHEYNKWIVDRIKEDNLLFPELLRPLAEHYINKRLIILSKSDQPIIIDPAHGVPTRNPLPDIVFWLADSFGLKDEEASRKLALGLMYSSLAFAVIDDMIDQEEESTSQLYSLSNMYLYRYMSCFDGLFGPVDGFWNYLAESLKKFNYLVYSDFDFKHQSHNEVNFDPLSREFLAESGKSYSTLVITTFAAIAYATGKESKISNLESFWSNYAIGHRVYDDLNDLMKDLRMEDYNHSSILLYTLQSFKDKKKLTEDALFSMLLNREFIEKIYGTMIQYFKAAREEARTFESAFLLDFMDDLILSQERNRDRLLEVGSEFFKGLENFFTS